MIATAPSVEYRLKLKGAKGGKVDAQGYTTIQSAAEFPDPTFIEEVREPMMQVELYTPKAYVGAVMQLGEEKRGEYTDMVYEAETAHLTYLMPLSEMIIDFFDRLKSVTAGYASLDYTFFDWVSVKVAKLDILLNHERVDALAFLAVESEAEARGREIVEKLSSVIPRQQFGIPVQAAIGGRIVARADVKPFRKDVIQKLYGGDRTRKDKLLSKQKKGKAKMKMIGRVEIPQSAFFEVLKRE
jgi:GTP-binding protein LepA